MAQGTLTAEQTLHGEVNYPKVISVNGKTGAVKLGSEDLTDGATIMHTTDTLLLDCGGAEEVSE